MAGCWPLGGQVLVATVTTAVHSPPTACGSSAVQRRPTRQAADRDLGSDHKPSTWQDLFTAPTR
jgi:hypothetical protein